jgi:hypothetical protein
MVIFNGCLCAILRSSGGALKNTKMRGLMCVLPLFYKHFFFRLKAINSDMKKNSNTQQQRESYPLCNEYHAQRLVLNDASTQPGIAH